MTGPAGGADGHGLAGSADALAFLARLTRLDPTTVVRLRAAADGRTQLWARLPWDALVTRTVAADGPRDATVSAAGLLAALRSGDDRLPERRDGDWRWSRPASAGRVVETLAAADVRRVATAAATTLRTAAQHGVAGRQVGQRMLRDALLDHVAVVVTAAVSGAPVRVEVTQRLVQAVVRMGFLGPGDDRAGDRVQVRLDGRWTGLSAPYGVAWLRSGAELPLTPV